MGSAISSNTATKKEQDMTMKEISECKRVRAGNHKQGSESTYSQGTWLTKGNALRKMSNSIGTS